MKTSIIKRVPDCFYFQVSEDYKAICLYEVGEKIKCNDCAAVLLSLYENFVNSRINSRTKNPHSFSASTGYIKKCLLGHYSDKTIIEANAFLENESYISIERKKTEKSNSLPNVITLNVDHINYMLGEYCKIKVQQNYITPYVKLHNPLCKIPQGGYGKLHNPLCKIPQGGYGKLQTEISIKNQVLEISNINSLSVPDDTSPSKQKGVKKEDSSAGLTKLVKSKFHTLVQKFGIDYHYPKSDAAWGIIHKGIKNVLIKEVCDPKLPIEENEKRLNDYFNRIYVMTNKRVFPFETPEKIDFTNICSATIVAKVLNYHIETSKIVYDGVVFNVTRTDANGVKYDGDLAVTAQGGVKFDLSKSMYDYQDPKDANNFSKLKNAIKNGRT